MLWRRATVTLATARKLHWSGAVGKSEADELAADLEYARRSAEKTGPVEREWWAHWIEVNERRLDEMMNGSPETIEARPETAAVSDLCGCGRPARHYGRCAWIRQQAEKRKVNGGGGQAVTVAKVKRASGRKAPALKPVPRASKPAVVASAPADPLVESLKRGLVELQVRNAKLEETIAAIENVIAIYEPK
jgi:hypothetical protein